jgi:hypothetical protein
MKEPDPAERRASAMPGTRGATLISAKPDENSGAPDPGSDKELASPLPWIIPFESFSELSNRPDQRIIVLWLNETTLGSRGKPLLNVAWLLCQLYPDQKPSNFVVLGPQESTTLAAMVREINDYDVGGAGPSSSRPCDDGPKTVLNGVPIYNFGATADDEAVARDAQLADPRTVNIGEQFKRVGMRYQRVINTDKRLAGVLVNELKWRNIKPTQLNSLTLQPEERPDHVAIIAEWDTIYGRSWGDTLAKCFASDCDGLGATTLYDQPWIFRYAYLRGLDGQLPGLASAKENGLNDDKRGDRKRARDEAEQYG